MTASFETPGRCFQNILYGNDEVNMAHIQQIEIEIRAKVLNVRVQGSSGSKGCHLRVDPGGLSR